MIAPGCSRRSAALWTRWIAVGLVALGGLLGVQLVSEVHTAVLNAELISAIKEDDCQRALRALRRGADARATDHPVARRPGDSILQALRRLFDSGRTSASNIEALPLIYSHGSAAPECPELVRALLDRGAAVDSVDSTRCTALLDAVLWNHQRTVQILLDYGADPNFKWGDRTSLYSAQYDCAKLLLSHSANPLAHDSDGMTPLFFKATCAQVDPRLLDLLLRHDPDINQRDAHGATMLTACFKNGMLQNPIHWLLKRGADVNAPKLGGTDAGYTPLMCVASLSSGYPWSVDILRDLLARGADVRRRSVSGESALDVAKKGGSQEIIAVLETWRRQHPPTVRMKSLNRTVGQLYIDGTRVTNTFDAAGQQFTQQGALGIRSMGK